jgi:Shikimate kinase
MGEFIMNVVFVGMPGAGKSTIGPLLAVKTGMEYIDTDNIIKEKTGKELRDIVIDNGFEEFLKIQENTILSMNPENMVIATGGSVVCSGPAMMYLKKNGYVVFLKLEFTEIENRLSPERRLARSSGKSLYDLFCERMPLYEEYSDLTIDCNGRSVDEIIDIILKNQPMV